MKAKCICWIQHGKTLLLILSLSAVASLVQLAYHGFLPPVVIPFGITIEGVRKLSSPIIWVDARPDDLFRISHVPGALNLNRANWDQALPRLFEIYTPGKAVIVYCSPDCSESEEIASRIRNLGLDQILVLEGGFDVWKQANPSL